METHFAPKITTYTKLLTMAKSILYNNSSVKEAKQPYGNIKS